MYKITRLIGLLVIICLFGLNQEIYAQQFIPLDSGLNNICYFLEMNINNNIYAVGEFMSADGVQAVKVAKWEGVNWSALGSGINGTYQALVVDDIGNVYVGGDLTNAGGIPANNIAKRDGTSWLALGWTFKENALRFYGVDDYV